MNAKRFVGIVSSLMFVGLFVALLVVLFSGCSAIEQYAFDKADDVWNVLTTDSTGNQIVDSIQIRSEHYWVEDIDTVYQNTDYRTRNGSMRIWFLENDQFRRNEAVFDTVIYIWRKK